MAVNGLESISCASEDSESKLRVIGDSLTPLMTVPKRDTPSKSQIISPKSLACRDDDSKFVNLPDTRPKKLRMSHSFLNAKSKCHHHSELSPKTSPMKRHSLRSLDLVYPEQEAEDLIIEHFKSDGLKNNPLVQSTQATEKIFKNSAGMFVCRTENCFKAFNTRRELRRHKLTHRVRKHVCPLEDCKRAFFEKSKLKRHMVVHTKKKEHNCPICGKKFGYKANVKTHMRTHTGERPFVCRIGSCGKSFAQASNRNAHEKTHYKSSEEKRQNRSKARSSTTKSNDNAKIQTTTQDDTAGRRGGRKRKASLAMAMSMDSSSSVSLSSSCLEEAGDSKGAKLDLANTKRCCSLADAVDHQHSCSFTAEFTGKRDFGSMPLISPTSAALNAFDHANMQISSSNSKPAGEEFNMFDLDDVVNDICKMTKAENQPSEAATSTALKPLNMATPAVGFTRRLAAPTEESSGFSNLLFSSFTSLGGSGLQDTEMNSIFKSDFGAAFDSMNTNSNQDQESFKNTTLNLNLSYPQFHDCGLSPTNGSNLATNALGFDYLGLDSAVLAKNPVENLGELDQQDETDSTEHRRDPRTK